MKKTSKLPPRKLSVTAESIRVLRSAAGGNLPHTANCGGGGDMFPLSNGWPTCCLVGTGCGNLSGTCC